jgi:hypothetical protein
MTRPSFGRAGLLTLLLLAGPKVAPAGAQSTEGLLAPAGRLRLEVAPTFQLWDDRFGLREQGADLIEEQEPLGYDVVFGDLLDLSDVEAQFRAILGTPTLDLVLGSTAAKISRERNEVLLGTALGVFDWLTIGVNVPLVQTRTEISYDFRGTDLGQTPSGTAPTAFRARLLSSALELEARRAAACPGAPECAALTALVASYGPFASELASAYGEPLFLASGSAPAAALDTRLAGFRAQAAQSAPGVTMPGPAPLAAPLSEAELIELLTGPPPGSSLLIPLSTTMGSFKLGDVELTAALRLVEGAAMRDSASAPARFRYLLGATALVRLPTGTTDHPDVPLDLGGADGQLDIEVGGFADLRWGRVGIQAEARQGMQQSTTLIRRVARPENVMPPAETRREVRWTPGDYFEVEFVPRWQLTDEFALGAIYRGLRKDADDYEDLGPLPDDGSVEPAAVLGRETQATLNEVGLGVAYSTVTSWREGRASVPLDMYLAVRKAISGSGGATPAGWKLEASGKAFVRLWGARSRTTP